MSSEKKLFWFAVKLSWKKVVVLCRLAFTVCNYEKTKIVWAHTTLAHFGKLENKDLRKLKKIQLFLFLGKTKWNSTYLKFDLLSQIAYYSFFVTASIQNL